MVASHPFWHPDEIFSFFLARETEQGRKRFPGIQNAAPTTITQTMLLRLGWTGFNGFINALRKQGVLLIGVGLGPLDEHINRNEKVSCLETMVKLLKLEADKKSRVAIHALREFINYEDNNGDNLMKATVGGFRAADERLNNTGEKAFSKLPKEVSDVLLTLQTGMFTGLIKKGWETINPANPQEFLNVFNTAYNLISFAYNQSILFQEAGDEYAKKKDAIKAAALPLTHNGEYRLLVVESDNPLMAKAVWNRNPSDAAVKPGILVIAKETGVADPDDPEIVGRHFAIMPSETFKQMGVMQEIYKILQQHVHRAQHQGKMIAFHQLGHYGTHSEVPQLYLDENQQIIMCGSRVDFDVPGVLDVELDLEIITEAIQTVCLKRFDKRHMNNCKKGVCVKVQDGTPCSLFCYNLAHCKAVQATTKQSSKGAGDRKSFGKNNHQQHGGGNSSPKPKPQQKQSGKQQPGSTTTK